MVVLVALLVGMLPAWLTYGLLPAQALPAPQRAKERVIVEVARGADPAAVARGLGVTPKRVYTKVFQGFAAELPAAANRAADRQRGVLRIWPDLPVQAEAQTLPTGVKRINADQNPWADIDGGGADINAGVAVLDTGIAAHPDLHIAGGENCIDPNNGDYSDGDGHGTHVAGTIAAIDDGDGVVSVAPGARLWAVKVLDDTGVGSISSVLCGLEWVSDNTDKIDVVNMSLSAKATRKDRKSCGRNTTPLHTAICRVVNEDGIPVVVAAGNSGQNAGRRAPATYSEVITVSAFADSDGRPGADGGSCGGDGDDTFAGFSNYGKDVDIAAPGVCIRSTWKDDGDRELSGTSMATSHVTGAIALYIDKGPGPETPAAVRTWLLTVASQPQKSEHGFTGDPDKFREPVLYLPST